jgi:hypothetical protein
MLSPLYPNIPIADRHLVHLAGKEFYFIPLRIRSAAIAATDRNIIA